MKRLSDETMPYNTERTDDVRTLLSHIPKVTEKRMFGSVGFLIDGKLILGVGDHQDHCMLVRVGKDRYDEALDRHGAAPAIMRGRPMTGWVFLTEAAIQTQEDLKTWVDLALSAQRNP